MMPCTFTGCVKPARSKKGGLCVAHGKQMSLKGELKPLLDRMPRAGDCMADRCERPKVARGYCGGHYQQLVAGKPITPLRIGGPCALDWCDRPTSGGFTGACKRHSARLRFFNVTVDYLNDLFIVRQGRRCAICRVDSPGRNDWHIDHDHACCPVRSMSCGTCVRGLLCSSCNLLLGHAKDDRATLASAIVYLAGYNIEPVAKLSAYRDESVIVV